MNRRKRIEKNKKNKCNPFILPMVGINYRNLPSNFINSYISKDYHVIMVFDKTDEYDEIFYHFLDRTRNNIRWYRSSEEDIDEISLVFEIPEIYKNNFDLFMLGRYTEFTESYKGVLCNFFGKKTRKELEHLEDMTEFDVIYPREFKRKQIAEHLSYNNSVIDWKIINEVLSRPDLEKEIYKSIKILEAQQI